MTAADITACADIMCSVYNNNLLQRMWSAETAAAYLRDFINAAKFIGFVLEIDSNVCGAIFCHEKVWRNNCELFIDEMLVNPAYQRQGYGSRLLKEAEQYINKKSLPALP